MSLGENLQKLRKARGLSQEELAGKMLLSRQTISLWETDGTVPTIENLLRLKEIFSIPVDKILCAEEGTAAGFNTTSTDTVCAALAYTMGIKPPAYAARKNHELSHYVDKAFDGERADRVLVYNTDAVAEWLYEKHPECFGGTKSIFGLELHLSTVMPPVTPVCYATLYTGAQPAVHGIQAYERPVVRIETIFDSLIAAGKRPALITSGKCSLGRIFLEREMDYFNLESGGASAVIAKAAEVILEDKHDFIVVYNGNYDVAMHRYGPESARALAELRANDLAFSTLARLVESRWRHHNTLLGFVTDHGCHEIDGGCGSHGMYMPEDINIVHLYKGYPRKKT